jgi:hypothetical protein
MDVHHRLGGLLDDTHSSFLFLQNWFAHPREMLVYGVNVWCYLDTHV